MATPRDSCVVFADVSGSTQLYETLGDAEALAAIERCLDALTQATRLNRGRVIKTIGDEIMAVFDTAAQGTQAASEMQQRIDALPPPAPGTKLAIRIGLHFGSVLEEDGDVFGDTVNTAARMTELAKRGQVITTGDTVAVLPDILRNACRVLDALAIKGKTERIAVCEYIWQDSAELTMMGSMTAPSLLSPTRLQLKHGDTTLTLSPSRTSITLGRDPGSDLIVYDPRASRLHARIELRRDKFILVDLSSNGTYVTFRGESEIVLKREELILRGTGRIVFGHAWSADPPAETLEFTVEN